MPRIFHTCLLWILLLSACSAIPTALQTVPGTTTEAPLPLPTTAVPDPDPISTIGTPHIDQPPDGQITAEPPASSDPEQCAYQWAQQDLPELSSVFQGALQAHEPEAQGSAFAFGENCLRNDGTIASFSAMETDFNITLQVSDLTNESDLGDWIVKVMQVIAEIPPDLIQGPRPGRVNIAFQSNDEMKGALFYINQYQELPTGISSAEIYQNLKVPE